jgi:hypothetical protein
MLICISKITTFLGIDNVVVPLISGFPIASNELHLKLCTMAVVTRWSSLASNVIYMWRHIATDLMFLVDMTYLKLLSLSIAFRKYLIWMVIISMIWNHTSPKHQWHLKLWVLIPRATLILICCFTCKFRIWAKTKFWSFAPEPYSGTLWVELVTFLGPNMW